MKKVFDQVQNLKPLSKKDVKGKLEPENKDVLTALQDLEKRNIFPTLYLEFLEKLEETDSKELAQQFLDIAIFANSNMATANILEWFLNGKIPPTYFFRINSMSTLRLAVERHNTFEQNQENALDRIRKYQDQQKDKGSKTISERLKKAEDEYFKQSDFIKEAKNNIKVIISSIESKLATGRKI
jgi:hypothetical protein